MMRDLLAYLPTQCCFQQFLTQNSMTPVPHAPYTPDLTSSNFFLSPRMQKVLKENCFADVEEIKQKKAEALEGIEIDKFKTCFEQGKKHLDRCIASNGEYLEG